VEGDPSSGGSTVVDLDAPLGHIPVLIRSGAALLLHSQPGYTTHASAATSYALLVSLSRESHAHGTAVIDDGETLQQPDVIVATQSRTLVFKAQAKSLEIGGQGAFRIIQHLGVITLLGIDKNPKRVRLDGAVVPSRNWVYDSAVQRLVVSDLSIDLNGQSTVTWG
jgi:alpha-glucosidase